MRPTTPREQLPSASRRLTSVDMLARFNISARTLNNWIRDPDLGLPAAMVIKNRYYWREDDVERWEVTRLSAPAVKVA